MHNVSHRMWTAHADYLRLTYNGRDSDGEIERAYATAVVRVGRSAGGQAVRAEPWRWMGYSGIRMGSVAYGKGVNGLLYQASGVLAAQAVDLRLPYTGVPRLDLQATYWYDAHWTGAAASVAALSLAARSASRGRPWAIRHINGMGAGDTCYIGTRGKNAKFIRVYDKYAESGRAPEWRNAWRYEIELTDEHAKYVYAQLIDWGQSEHSVLAMMSNYFDERGVRLPEVHNSELFPASRVKRPETDNERRLAWLKNQVRPAIDKMIANGVSLAQVLSALGLDGRPEAPRAPKPLEE